MPFTHYQALGSRLRWFFPLALVLLLAPVHLSAQYMYLDSDGDGLHSAADQINPTGATNVNVYLRTDQNRNGTAAVCPTAGSPFTINSYGVNLRASGGTIAWGTFVNHMPTMSNNNGGRSSTELAQTQYGSAINPPGLYLLATITLSVASGTPALEFVPYSTIPSSYDPTSFGSQCPGFDQDNTMKLGSEWFDVDGLPYGTSTPVNYSPTLVAISDMTVVAGTVVSQSLTASDPDAQFLTISKVAGPSYMAVLATSSEPGHAAAVVRLSPLPMEVGSSTGTVSASDGELSVERSFAISVTPQDATSPSLEPVAGVRILPGTVQDKALYARDPDGEPLTFRKVSGPSFVDVTTLHHGPAASTGSVRIAPTLCDVGPWTVELSAQSGSEASSARFGVEVLVPTPPPSVSSRTFAVPSIPRHVELCDLNEDGNIDAVAITEANEIAVLLGRPDGTFSSPVDYPTGLGPWFAASGDWNQDGHVDVAVAHFGGVISIFHGSGDGSLTAGTSLVDGQQPNAIASADLNRDGLSDLVVANGSAASVSVFLGAAAGGFAPRMDFPIDRNCYGVTIGDFNLDGRLDVVSANWSAKTISFLPGYGDGTFGPRRDTPCEDWAFSTAAKDFNHDGLLDIAVANYGGSLVVLLGNGDGSFTKKATLLTTGGAEYVVAEDFDGDGNVDLAAAGQDFTEVNYFSGGGDGGFGPRRTFGGGSPFALDSADLDHDGRLDIVTAEDNRFQPTIKTHLNPGMIGAPPDARAFVQGERQGAGTGNSSALLRVRLEPVNGTYANANVNGAAVSLYSPGTGSVDRIFAVDEKAGVSGDLDHNGIDEIGVHFSSSDLAMLFDRINGKQSVPVRLEGALLKGGRFCAALSVPAKGSNRPLAAVVAPNPLNPQGTISFLTSKDGYLRVRLFDASGRLVRVLADAPQVSAGPQEVRIDGRTAHGTPIASGIYFYQIDSSEGSSRGRVAILK
jgi:hypothetical protein